MLRRGVQFEFDAPDGWQEERDGSRFVYRGPQHEELIVSGTTLQGEGSKSETQAVRSQMIEDGLEAIRHAAAHPDLATLKDLRRDEGACALECWTMVSGTHDGQTLFTQALIAAGAGVLLVTFESGKDVSAFETFRRIVKSVRPVQGN